MTSRWRRSPGVTTLALVAAMALLVFGLALVGCGGGDETTTTAATAETTATTETAPETTATTEAAVKVTKMAVTAPEEGTDFGWNQQGVESAQKVAAEIGAEITVADGAGYEDITPILRELVEVDGSQLTIAFASGYGTAGVQQAQDLKVPHIIVGQFEAGLIPGLAQDIETRAQNGSYLAGIVAAKTSKTGTLGIVISADDENWIKMAAGFVLGAQSVNPDVKLLLAQIGQAGYADAPGGKRVTESVIAGGADVVFGLGDGSSFGMIQAVETATPPSGADKVWFIDVIGDKTSLDKKGVLLTSVVWDYAPAFKAAVDALGNGTFGSEIIWLDIDNGGIDLLKSDKIPADVWAEVEKARAGIMDGSIKVPEIASKADVEAMIK